MDGKYLVYRVYTKEERPDIEDRSILYGWSTNKSIVKAFCKQRSKDKYQVLKMSNDDIIRTFSEEIDDTDAMIDFIKLKSAKTHEVIYLFMTLNEMRETEKKIQKMFLDQASLERIPGNGNYLELFMNLDDYYADALFFIGYRPREVDILFPSADPRDDYASVDRIEQQIDQAYDGLYGFPQEELRRSTDSVVGLSIIEDVANKICYSVESFIKVMREDM